VIAVVAGAVVALTAFRQSSATAESTAAEYAVA
jgi:hypothetical protein